MRKIQKTYGQLRENLNQSLYRLEGSVDRYKANGQIAELGTIVIELRGLLLGEALLIQLAREKSFALELYTMPSPPTGGLSKTLRKKITHVWAGDSISLICEKPWTKKVSVTEWLEIPIAEIKGVSLTPKRLIAEIASGLGPAHYSSDISNALLEMTAISLGGVPSYFRTLLRFAAIILELGKKFLAAH